MATSGTRAGTVGKGRGNGEGSIRLRADGRYEVRVTDPRTGQRRSAFTRSEAEAKRLLRRMAVRADDGDSVLDSGLSLDRYVEAWLEERAGKRRAESTVREYGYRLDKWVLPILGRMRLREVTVVDVEDMLDALADQGLSEGTLKAIRNALAAVFTDAQRARQVTSNPARVAQLPERGNRGSGTGRRVTPTDAQVAALVEACQEQGDLEAMVVLLAGTGCRIGEALGALWDDMDLRAGVWTVGRTVTRDAANRVVLGSATKTRAGRTLPLTDEVVAALKVQRRAVTEARLASPVWVEDHGALVFPSSIGTVQDPHNVRSRFRVVAHECGFPGTPHSLRHWYTTTAMALKTPEAVVARILGHASVGTTRDVYTHLRHEDADKVARAAADRIAAVRATRKA